jgi:hypothetical protein
MAANRSAGVDAAIAAEQLNEARRARANAEAADAWKRTQQAAYIKGGGMQSPGLAGIYSRPAPHPSFEAQQMAQDPRLLEELARRARYEYEPFQFDPALLKAGKLEKGLGVGSVIGTGLDIATDLIPGGGVVKAIGKGLKKLGSFLF